VILIVVIALSVAAPDGIPIWVWGAVGAVAAMAVNILLAPPPPKLGSLAGLAGANRPAESPTFSITGSQNKANPFGPIPKVYGRHRLFVPVREEVPA
jgi:hypothetical protein